MEDQTAVAEATAKVMARYWPAEVQLPAEEEGGQRRHLRPCRVYVTDAPELIVYSAPGLPVFRERVDLDATDDPPPAHPRQTWDVATTAGLVSVTPAGGCGCASPLKRWWPDFASHVTTWRRT